jgi:threonine dehydrogenase-like Zn-dependent dehydrogenase
MKALVVRKPNDVQLMDVGEPIVGPEQVLLRPVVSGLCGTDLEIIAGTIDPAYVHYPVTLGHEWVGRRTSDNHLVVVEGIISCGECDECHRGATNRCRTYDEIGFTRHGALSELIAVPASLVHELNADVSAFDAALIEPMAVVWRALTRLPITPNASCLVVGDGSVALLATLLLQRFAPASVTMLGLRPAQATLAAEAGAASFVTSLGDERYDVVIEAAGQGAAISTAFSAVARGGMIILLGLPAQGTTVSIAPDGLVNNDIIVQASFSYTRVAWAAVVAMLNEGLVHPGFLITHRYYLDEWRDAIAALSSPQLDAARGKVVLLTGTSSKGEDS